MLEKKKFTRGKFFLRCGTVKLYIGKKKSLQNSPKTAMTQR